MRTSTRQPSSVTDRRDTPFFNGLLGHFRPSAGFFWSTPRTAIVAAGYGATPAPEATAPVSLPREHDLALGAPQLETFSSHLLDRGISLEVVS